MLNQLREYGLAEVHASLSCLRENGSEMARFSQIRFKSFLTEIAITPSGTIDYSQRSIFPRTAVSLIMEPTEGRLVFLLLQEGWNMVSYREKICRCTVDS
jgi:long-subunit acyl-CoA synthetase (AMP-forming)